MADDGESDVGVPDYIQSARLSSEFGGYRLLAQVRDGSLGVDTLIETLAVRRPARPRRRRLPGRQEMGLRALLSRARA